MGEPVLDEKGETFFNENLPPTHFEEARKKVETFCSAQGTRGLVLVTSGGTTVPLELNTGERRE